MPNYYNQFNKSLTSSEQETNAIFIWNYLKTRGWSIDAVSGMLGNFEAESRLNPNIVETTQKDRWPNWGNYGFGIAQWTPWFTKQQGGEWLDPANYHGSNNPTYGYWASQNGYTIAVDGSGTIGKMEPQLDYLDNNLGTGKGKAWVRNYKITTVGPEQAAKDFYTGYEISAAGTWGTRPDKAVKWYNFLTGHPPQPPTPPSITDKSKIIIVAYAAGVVK